MVNAQKLTLELFVENARTAEEVFQSFVHDDRVLAGHAVIPSIGITAQGLPMGPSNLSFVRTEKS